MAKRTKKKADEPLVVPAEFEEALPQLLRAKLRRVLRSILGPT